MKNRQQRKLRRDSKVVLVRRQSSRSYHHILIRICIDYSHMTNNLQWIWQAPKVLPNDLILILPDNINGNQNDVSRINKVFFPFLSFVALMKNLAEDDRKDMWMTSKSKSKSNSSGKGAIEEQMIFNF